MNPLLRGPKRVKVVNVKSWQGGFDFRYQQRKIDEDTDGTDKLGKKRFRELTLPNWSKALVEKVKELTGADKFTYVLALTLEKRERALWEQSKQFRKALRGNPIEVITLKEMVERIMPKITRTPAGTDIGRTLQLLRAAGMNLTSDRPERTEIDG